MSVSIEEALAQLDPKIRKRSRAVLSDVPEEPPG